MLSRTSEPVVLVDVFGCHSASAIYVMYHLICVSSVEALHAEPFEVRPLAWPGSSMAHTACTRGVRFDASLSFRASVATIRQTLECFCGQCWPISLRPVYKARICSCGAARGKTLYTYFYCCDKLQNAKWYLQEKLDVPNICKFATTMRIDSFAVLSTLQLRIGLTNVRSRHACTSAWHFENCGHNTQVICSTALLFKTQLECGRRRLGPSNHQKCLFLCLAQIVYHLS